MASVKEITVPDIGISGEVTVIEIAVKAGDTIPSDHPIVTLEGEKASMEIPAPMAGKVDNLLVKVGDKVKTGSPLLKLIIDEKVDIAATSPITSSEKSAVASSASRSEENISVVNSPISPTISAPNSQEIYASPSVRRLARELSIDLHQVVPTGAKNRLQKSDLLTYIKSAMQGTNKVGSILPQPPMVDFSKFGAIDTQPLSKIKKYTAQNLHRNWLLVPHVTQFEEADITQLEAFRKQQQLVLDKQGIKLTPLVFLMKAVVAVLKQFPQFNASLDASGEQLILKKYFHIGVAVDTPEGLVVPVIRDVDQKSLVQLAKELAEISIKARAKQLTPAEMQGSSFTISSLGGIGGTGFTPIVNLPDVAILGVSKSSIKPVWQEDKFIPRLMLPLSLSYDHRVIDGAEGARFIVQLSKYLSDIRLILM